MLHLAVLDVHQHRPSTCATCEMFFDNMHALCSLMKPTMFSLVIDRGYWPFDSRTLPSPQQVAAVSRDMMVVPVSLWRRLDGFDEALSPRLEDADLCLRARQQSGLEAVLITGLAAGVSLQPLLSRAEDTTNTYTSEQFNPLLVTPAVLSALHSFSSRWMEVQAEERRLRHITPARLSWVIHCGGSQGMEAATILQHLYK